jgi:ketosteroid isomerase-like protein
MKMEKLKPITLIIVVILIFAGSSVSEQEWSKEQKEAWKLIETFWEFYSAKDAEGCLACFHQDYMGWSYRDKLPHNKLSLEESIKFNLENYSTDSYEIKPVAISIFDDVAIVHFNYSGVYSDTAGNTGSYKGRMTDILIKQDGKWVFIADHGGSTK